MDKNKGFSNLLIAIIITAIVASAVSYFALSAKLEAPYQKLFVSVKTRRDVNPAPPVIEAVTDTSDWKTYRNEKYGFEFKYPLGWANEQGGNKEDDYLSIVYKPEEAKCGYGAGCFYPGSLFARVISKTDLLPSKRNSLPYYIDDYAYEYAKEVLGVTPLTPVSFANFYLGNHLASTIKIRSGVIRAGTPNITAIIDYSPSLVVWIEGAYFEKYQDSLIPIFDSIISSFQFIQPTSSLDVLNWKTYRNEKYGFEFKYPANHIVYSTLTSNSHLIPSDSMANYIYISENENRILHGDSKTPTLTIYSQELGPLPAGPGETEPISASTTARDVVFADKKGTLLSERVGADFLKKRLLIEFPGYVLIIQQNTESEFLDKILSTFKFIEPNN